MNLKVEKRQLEMSTNWGYISNFTNHISIVGRCLDKALSLIFPHMKVQTGSAVQEGQEQDHEN